ncbi:MAG: DNA internalization-related competence protein ComEC/Rec2 [Mobilitalea sp.]
MIRRPMVGMLGAYLAGLFLAWYNVSLPYIFLFILISYLILLLINFIRWKKAKGLLDTFLWSLPIFFLLGFHITQVRLQVPAIYNIFEEELPCEVTGQITLIVDKPTGKAIYLKNNQIYVNNETSYLSEQLLIYSSDTSDFLIGNKIKVEGTLIKFSAPSNPGQFNEQLYYLIENIDFKMYAEKITIIDPRYSGYRQFLLDRKKSLVSVYSKLLSDKESGALIAMLLGEKQLLQEDIKDLYQNNGIAHLLAISGLHISLLGMFVYKLMRWSKVPGIFATILSILFIYSYGVLTNFSVSTQRAVIMMMILLLAAIPGKTYDMISATALSAFVILVHNPLQIFSAGFLLSYGAVIGIAVIYPSLKKLTKLEHPILNSLFLSLSAQLTTTPFVLFYFYQLPTYGIIINLIVLPFVTVLTLSSILAGIVGLIYLPAGVVLIGATNYILQFYEVVCRVAAKLPFNLLTLGKPSVISILIYVLILVVFVFSVKKSKSKFLYLLPTLSMLVFLIPKPNDGLTVTFLDVGQGDSIFIKSDSGSNYLVDGGSSNIKKVGEYRIKPFLLSQGISKLDYVIVTHSDNDHISGIKELLEEEQVKMDTLLLPYLKEDYLKENDTAYLELKELALSKGISVQYIKAGDYITDDKLQLLCLHPSPEFEPTSVNSYSTVLSISYVDFDLLLTGDLEKGGETALTRLLKQSYIDDTTVKLPETYEVLKVAHHGSKYSTSIDFLKAVSPSYSIISCGIDNSYGHPNEETLNRLLESGSRILKTTESGAVTIITGGERMRIEEYIKGSVE